ncbi:hypothetical protein J4E83_010004 [Alternaria metachromatica]|uniref:uncharacterized protein n=1 Tax=Alternaria metachromatica TaxID=283354 RepID=UPI0020C4234B|nr:uncharacterized protein J4E83_010004 [Alternaria metachromatica]KAI4606632.1 hypothetical protein J4E83_010004 [Alternaria metachromatica]
MAMSKYETILWEEKMKEQIMSLARATYTDSFSQCSVFDVIHTTIKGHKAGVGVHTLHATHLIVYKWPSIHAGLEFVITVECKSFAEGLESLMARMQDQLGRSIARAEVDKVNSFIEEDWIDSARAGVVVEEARFVKMRAALGKLRMVFKD